ncbi:MAG: hypothetical protein U9R51_10410, partial [Actinomycetota bacterium]|nr:hypothetical protein [Actinomycetota bacterium]
LAPTSVVISVDDEDQWAVSRQGGRFELSSLGLEAGAHAIRIGTIAKLGYTTTDTLGLSSPRSAGSLAHLLRIEGGDTQWQARRVQATPDPLPHNVIAVTGAKVQSRDAGSERRDEPVIFRRKARRYFIVGAEPGQIRRFTEPKLPGWLKAAGLDPGSFEASAPFPPVWTVHDWGPHLEAHCHQQIPPEGRADGDDYWAELFDPTEYTVRCDLPDLWSQYVNAAGWEQ